MVVRRTLTPLVPALVVLVLASLPALAATKQVTHHATKYGTLTVSITTTAGTVWGKVAIKPLRKTCKSAKCTYKKVKVGTKLTLTETPTDTATWPFGGWTVNGKQSGSSKTTTFKMGKSGKATAYYFDNTSGEGTLTVNITQTGSTVWGSVAISPGGNVCRSAQCKYQIPIGTALTLTETPTDSSTWPFNGWTLDSASKGTATTLNFAQSSADTATAAYVLNG